MTGPFDLLGSASFLVDDHKRSAAAIEGAVGIAPPKPHWVLDTPGRGILVTFLRPAPSVAVSPTPIEIVSFDGPGVAPAGDALPLLPAVSRAQGQRPTKVHATDIAVADIDEIIERCRRDGRRHWVQGDATGVKRVWIGFDADEPTEYRRDGDGGLHFEFLPTEALRLPPTVFEAPELPALAGDGALIGLAWRTYLVTDLDAVLGEVAGAFGWEPTGAIEVGADGGRRARLGFRLASSSGLLLVQPGSSGEEAGAIGRWGAGAWSLTIRVDGLDAKAEDLRRRGTVFREVASSFGAPTRVLRVDGNQTPGCLFDLVDATEAPF